MADNEEPRAETRCDECKQTDDHPKVHYGVETYHHDCLPSRARREVIDADPNGIAQKVIQAAEKGTHGPKLLAHIEKLHQEG
jgi:hypothetical protein